MGKFIDMTGWVMKEHGVPNSRWTVIDRVNESGPVKWNCICECGTKSVRRGDSLRTSLSCGCYQKERVTKDYTNQTFGRLTAIKPTKKRSGSNVIWECKCSCGNPNPVYVSTSDLKKEKGGVKSCGCLLKERDSEVHKLNLIGRTFGRLTVLEETEERKNTEIIWLCKCECGSLVKVRTGHLTSGDTQSCGCLKSKGEEKISNILTELNINFEKEKIFKNCQFTNKKYPRFDFYLPNYNTIIEYDGKQHFIQGNSYYDNKETFLKTKEHDQFKNNWCKENNIKLIRIPYIDFNKIDINYLKERLNLI